MINCSLHVSDIIRDLRWEISKHGTIEVLIKEIERITSQEKQERLLAEEKARIQAIATELRKAIVDKKRSNQKEKERLTRKIISMQVL